jgi:hypothetical protein
MLKLIGGAVLVWLVFRVLDSLFRSKQKLPDLKPGEFIIQTKDGEHYVVRDAPAEDPELEEEGEHIPEQHGNVVKFPKGGRHG